VRYVKSLAFSVKKKTVVADCRSLADRIVERHIKTSLDLIVLAMLNGEPMYGYKIIAAIHKKFGVLLSPGSLYPLLHLLEENKLIESRFQEGKIVYVATSDGKKRFQSAFVAYKTAMRKMENFIKLNGENSP